MAIFTPRFNYYGIPESDYYNAWNAYQGINAMPNCVAYTYGRFNELARVTANPHSWPTGNGNQWYSQAASYGLQRGNVPQVGACICWDNIPGTTDEPEGHVAIVERLIRSAPGQPVTAFRISNSLYSETDRQPKNEKPYFFCGTVQMSNLGHIDYDNGDFSEYVFQGFIYHPNFPPAEEPTTINDFVAALASKMTKSKKNLGSIIIKRRRN